MAFKDLIAFGAGELTPELWERGNLDKFRTGLKTLRNATVTKAGGLRGRPGLVYSMGAYDSSNSYVRYYPIPYRDLLFRFDVNQAILYFNFNYDTYFFDESVEIDLTAFLTTADQVSSLQFSVSEKYVYCFGNFQSFRISLDTTTPTPEQVLGLIQPAFWNFNAASFAFNTTTYIAPTGYGIDYYITSSVDGVESSSGKLWQGSNLPINVGEGNNIIVTIDTTDPDFVDNTSSFIEMRVYRRPRNGGGYGFIGICDRSTSGSNYLFKFTDTGIGADYTNNPPLVDVNFYADTFGAITVAPSSGLIYQGRLVVNGTSSRNKAFASRSGSTAFTRDFPLQDDSALNFKTGFEGAGNINRFLDSNGLFMFTNAGIYKTPSGLLTPFVAFADRKSSVVHDADIIPLGLGTGLLVFNKKLRAVIRLFPDNTSSEYAQDELSIFSNHLFRGREIVAWAIEESDTQVIWMVLDNGTVLSLSYQAEQQLQSWARHDTDGLFKDVFVQKTETGEDVVFFVVERGTSGVGNLERMSRKFPDDWKDYIGSDASIFFKTDLLPGTDTSNVLRITPVVLNTWDGEVLIKCTSTGVFENSATFGQVGDVFRYFREGDNVPIDFTVTQFIDSQNIKATPSMDLAAFLPDNLTQIAGVDTIVISDGFYVTGQTYSGLDHLEGMEVSVRLDGFTHASPLNVEDTHESYTVVGGSITLNGGARGAIVSIGLPYTQDIQTLAVDTVNEGPVKLESQVANRMYVSYFESRGVFIGNDYPDDDTNLGMASQEIQFADFAALGGALSITPIEPYTRREEAIVNGSWSSLGSMALRNVDPQPLGIRAIILDEEIISVGNN